MPTVNLADQVRRSSRVPLTLPIVVTSLEPAAPFSEVCETLIVNAHGCSMFSPSRLDAGVPVQFRKKQGRTAQAHVVDCQPMSDGQMGWQVSARLDRPENFWELESCPEDWLRMLDLPNVDAPRKGSSRGKDGNGQASLKLVSDKSQPVATEQDMLAMITAAVQPLQAEIMELKERLARRDPKRSNFEISLTHIPSEVEEKIWLRLRDDLGAQALNQARAQSEQVFEVTKEAIGKKIREGQNEFREHLTKELQTVEQRSQALAGEIADSVRKHFESSTERFQQKVSEAGTQMERQSEERLRSVQQRLAQEHAGYRQEMQKIQSGAASEASRLQAQATTLGGRIAELEDTACRLEGDLDARLTRMSADAITNARKQLESAVNVVLKELGSRNAKELEAQLEDARAKLKTVQKGIEVSVSELVKTEVAANLLSFGQTMEVLAQDSVTRWRNALARNLKSMAQTLSQDFKLDAVPGTGESQDTAAD